MARVRVPAGMRKLTMADGRGPAVASADPGTLTGDETVDDLVAAHPALRVPLMAYGVCTCCGAAMTLRQNAEAHGVPLEAVLEDLRRELAKPA